MWSSDSVVAFCSTSLSQINSGEFHVLHLVALLLLHLIEQKKCTELIFDATGNRIDTLIKAQ